MKGFRRPLVVAGIVATMLLAGVTGYLTVSGVLPAARSYSAQVERAKELCFPVGSAELAQKFPIVKSDGVLISEKICATTLQSLPSLDYPKASVRCFPLPGVAEKGWQKVQPALARIEELRKAKQWAGAYDVEKFSYGEVLRPGQSEFLSRLAGHLANAGQIEDACRVWVLLVYLNRATGESISGGSARILELSTHHYKFKVLLEHAPRWRANASFRACVAEWKSVALRKIDYRRMAWREANFLEGALASGEDLEGSWSTPFGRNLKLNGKEPFRRATRAENLRGYVEHFAILERAPFSALAYDDFVAEVRASHARANRISADFLKELGPMPGLGANAVSREKMLAAMIAKVP